MFDFINNLFRRSQENNSLVDDSGSNDLINNKLSPNSNTKNTSKLIKNRITQEELPVFVEKTAFVESDFALEVTGSANASLNNLSLNNRLRSQNHNGHSNGNSNGNHHNGYDSYNKHINKQDTNPFNHQQPSFVVNTTDNNDSLEDLDDLDDSLEDLNKDALLHADNQINPFYVPNDVIALINYDIASKYEIIPVAKDDSTNTITFLYANQLLRHKAELRLKTELPNYLIKWQEFDQESLGKLIKNYYLDGLAFEDNINQITSEKLSEIKEEFDAKEEATLEFDYSGELSNEGNKVRDLIAMFVNRASWDGATDLDFDNNQVFLPNGKRRSELSVRARINGINYERYKDEIPRKGYDAITNVMKQLSGLDSVKHKDDDTGIARAVIKRGREVTPVELRVQFIPSPDRGIGVSMRIQKKQGFKLSLSSIGLFPYQEALLRQHSIEVSSGCTLVSGKINRGKNWTLVSFLLAVQDFYRQINRLQNITLIEDPPEFVLDGIRQIPLLKGKTYADRMKAILRFNPDFISIGEIRDNDGSAEMLMNLTNIGHPTSATIHTNSACEVPDRLVNLGISRYKIAEALDVVTNQILVQKSCSHCTKQKDSFRKIENLRGHLEKLGLSAKTEFLRSSGRMANGQVCSECSGTGFNGRTGVFEILVMSDEMKEMILRPDSIAFQLRRQALKENFQTLWHNGLRKVALGEIALSELLMHIPHPTNKSEGLDIVTDFDTSQDVDLDFLS